MRVIFPFSRVLLAFASLVALYFFALSGAKEPTPRNARKSATIVDSAPATTPAIERPSANLPATEKPSANPPAIEKPSCYTLSSTKRRTGSKKWVISYGLYGGENPRYVAAINKTLTVHSKVLFPEWTIRIYYDDTISNETKQFLIDNGAELLPGPATVRNKMNWRFLSGMDPDVERFSSRDGDSFLTLREKWAVDEWVKSGKKFHNMRDHPWGGKWEILGGMWGAVRGAVPADFRAVLEGDADEKYLADMHVIIRHLWPLMKKDSLQHDAFTCTKPKFGENKPFPYPRIGWEFVGAVVINQTTGEIRRKDVQDISRARPPAACIPKLKPLVLSNDLFYEPRVERQCTWHLEQMEKQEIPGCPYDHICKAEPESSPCQVQLVRIEDVFVDWDHGEGYGPMFDADTVFAQYPLKKLPPSLFQRNSTSLLERISYFPRLAHVFLPYCETPWGFAALVVPRLRMILEQLPASVPILLVRNSMAEKMIPLLSKLDGFNASRIIWCNKPGPGPLPKA